MSLPQKKKRPTCVKLRSTRAEIIINVKKLCLRWEVRRIQYLVYRVQYYIIMLVKIDFTTCLNYSRNARNVLTALHSYIVFIDLK